MGIVISVRGISTNAAKSQKEEKLEANQRDHRQYEQPIAHGSNWWL